MFYAVDDLVVAPGNSLHAKMEPGAVQYSDSVDEAL